MLTAGHVHAFGVCTSTNGTTNLQSNTQYYFADANNSASGGASFTTNGSGYGPNDSADWNGASYFGADYKYWTNIGTGTGTVWDGSQCTSGNGADCLDFTNGTTSWSAAYGELASGNTGTNRWIPSLYMYCNNTYHLVCFVNP